MSEEGTKVEQYLQNKMLEEAKLTQQKKSAESAEKKASFRKFYRDLVKANPGKTKAWYMRRYFEAGYTEEQFKKASK